MAPIKTCRKTFIKSASKIESKFKGFLLGRRQSSRKVFSSFLTAAAYRFPAAGGSHPGSKADFLFSSADIGLKCWFHWLGILAFTPLSRNHSSLETMLQSKRAPENTSRKKISNSKIFSLTLGVLFSMLITSFSESGIFPNKIRPE